MPIKYYPIVLLCLSVLSLSAQIEVDWTTTAFDHSDKDFYLGVYPLTTFEDQAILAHKLKRKSTEDQNIWDFELLDATTGNPTGDIISNSDIPFLNTFDKDPEFNQLVKTGDGYMAYINERDKITFVKYDKELNILDPTAEGTASIDFEPSTQLTGFGNAESVASSYGIVGATWGRDDNSAQSEATPYIFACDTSLNVRFSRRLENAAYYFGNRFLIAVNGQDEIFTAGHTKGQVLLRSDTVVVSKLAADGELLYTNHFVLPPGSLPRAIKMDMNAEETELLVSGMILVRDILDNVTSKAYIARINMQDGSLIKLFSYFAHQLGGTPNEVVEIPMAQYDAQGNIVLTTITWGEQIDIDANRIDLDGNILDNTEVFTNLNGFPFPFSYRFNKIGASHYLSGSYQISGSDEKEAFVAKLGVQEVVSNISENRTAPISFRISPNPTNGLLHIQWNNETNGNYQLTIMNQLSQEIQSYSGEVFAEPTNLEFNIAHLPAGTYFVKLALEDGFAIQTILKQ